mmetsp:Transcript_28804/g.66552  ORF Transcript_28804/g.66552 Transcript_28804/m.66552 type:complete len:200 (+) Transcript_28804:858-1457(+)
MAEEVDAFARHVVLNVLAVVEVVEEGLVVGVREPKLLQLNVLGNAGDVVDIRLRHELEGRVGCLCGRHRRRPELRRCGVIALRLENLGPGGGVHIAQHKHGHVTPSHVSHRGNFGKHSEEVLARVGIPIIPLNGVRPRSRVHIRAERQPPVANFDVLARVWGFTRWCVHKPIWIRRSIRRINSRVIGNEVQAEPQTQRV